MILNHEDTRSEKNNQNSYLSKSQVKYVLLCQNIILQHYFNL